MSASTIHDHILVYQFPPLDCTGATQVGLKLLRRIAPENANGPLTWNDTRISFDCGIRFTMFRVSVPAEVRDSLPIPGGYYSRTWVYTSLPIPGKANLALYVNRIEGHRSTCFRNV